MNPLDALLQYPLAYHLALVLIIALTVDALRRQDVAIRMIQLAIIVTISFWYLVEPLLAPEDYLSFPMGVISLAYGQVCLFLLAFRLLMPFLTKRLTLNEKSLARVRKVPVQAFMRVLVPVWLMLTILGISLMKGDVLGALFPIASRASEKGSMWARAGVGGSTDFLISIAGYLHLFVCSSFGLVLLFQHGFGQRLLTVTLMVISWPYFVFLGARNQLLAVCAPLLAGYIIHTRQSWRTKLPVLLVALVTLEVTLRLIIQYRSVGFQEVVAETKMEETENTRHLGMNMGQELLYINVYQQLGWLEYHWGRDYLAELANVIPRPLWPNKPALGYEYAILRGFGRDDGSGEQVWATVSRGIIGQGVSEFGPWLGPMAAALLASLYGATLHRWWQQRRSLMRFSLFLVGLGTTFNLGRDFTLLVLWPVVFGYVMTLAIEVFRNRTASPLTAAPGRAPGRRLVPWTPGTAPASSFPRP